MSLRNSGQVQNREIFQIIEQTSCEVPGLTESEAMALESLGRDLRGLSRTWSDNSSDNLDGQSSPKDLRSVIRVNRRPGDSSWRVFVSNAVGVIGINDLQILVRPKIPMNHFDFLVSWSINPSWTRLGEGKFHAEDGSGFLPSMWISFLDALAVTLKADLHHDYAEVKDEPPYVRGRLDLRRSYVNLGRGRLAFPSIFDELSVDNPVNRVLRAAVVFINQEATRIFESLASDERLRQRVIYRLIADRAREAQYQLSEVGDLYSSDLEVDTSRLAVHQQRAFELGRHILSGIGRTIEIGDKRVSCYLYPTPPIIESGIRNLLNSELSSDFFVTKQSRTAAKLRFNPDLVLESRVKKSAEIFATGDVKYRLRKEDWPREFLEQAIVFADVFRANQGFFIDFSNSELVPPSVSESINSQLFHRFSWPTHSDFSPAFSAQYVLTECRRVLKIGN